MGHRLITCCLLSLLPVFIVSANPDRIIEDIRVTRTGSSALVQIAMGCRMRLLEQQPQTGGDRLRIILVMDHSCGAATIDPMNEVSRPSGAGLAEIDDVLFDTTGAGRGVITVNFQQPVGFKVSQKVTGGLTIEVNLSDNNFETSAPVVTTTPVSPQSNGNDLSDVRVPRPLRLRPAPPQEERYALLLGVFQDAQLAAQGLPERYREFTTYTTEIPVGNKFWQGLHLGFFASELEATNAIADLSTVYPDAWSVVVDRSQQNEAKANQVDPEPVQALPEPTPTVVDAQLDDATLTQLMAAGKKAIVERRYVEAIDTYQQIVEVNDNPHQRQAREFLGLAYERNGQLDHAQAEYRRYLEDYPNTPELARVEARLTALESIDSPAQVTRSPEADSDAASRWQSYAGFAQYYRYNIEEIPSGLGQVDELSGLTTYGNFMVERHGDRFDVAARANASYYYETTSDNDSLGNTGWVSHGYLDVTDKDLQLHGRLGRQTRTGSGVLGRFDGLLVGYQFRPNMNLNVVLGRPVESPRYQYNDRRFFYGASVDFENLLDGVDFTVFTHRQTVDGIEDRNAVGGEVHYSTDRWNVIGVTDYDLGYQTLNTALVSSHFRLNDVTTVNAFFDFGAQPYLTTQNALAGQTTTSIETLRQTFTESQIRTIARNRTAQAFRGSMGFVRTLNDRYKLNADITYTEFDATVASAGVAALPASGPQYFYNFTLTQTGWFKPGALTLVTLRYQDTRTFSGPTLIFDTRYPLRAGFRFNPRMSVTQRDNQDLSTQTVATGSVRLLYRWGERFLLELEGGIRWSDRELPAENPDPFFPQGNEQILGNYFTLGYRADF